MNFNDLKLVAKLTFAHIWHRPARLILTVLATVAAASIVVWVVSGYDSLLAKFDEFADHYLGRYEFVLSPSVQSDPNAPPRPFGGPAVRIPKTLVEELRRDPLVAVADPIVQTRARITKFGAPPEELGRGGDRNSGRNSTPNLPGGGTVTEPPENRTSTAADADSDMPSMQRPGAGGGPGGFPGMGAQGQPPTLVGTDAAAAPYTLVEGRWIDVTNPDALEAAVSSGVAERLKLKLGDEIEATSGGGFGRFFGNSDDMGGGPPEPWKLKVVGIVEQRKPLPATPPIIGLPAMRGPPLTRGPASAAVYVPMSIAQDIANVQDKYDLVGIILKPGHTLEEFRGHWEERLAKMTPPAALQSLQEVDQELNDSTTSDTIRGQAYAATGISLLAALFIIFSTLSMGVDERIRQFGMLRAVTLTKAQVAAMIVIESLFLGAIGWGGGLLAGWGLLKIMTGMRPDLFPVGSRLGLWCVVLSGACAIGGALAGAVMPAWKATRVKPLDAMAPQTTVASVGFPWWPTIVGLVLISVNPLLVFWVPMPDTSRYLMSAAIGCTAMGVGFILLAPAAILITERICTPIVTRLFGLNSNLLALQLTTNLWRTLGTTVAITLGLGLFIAMQTWGYSMLGPFTPGEWVPDMVIHISPMGIPDSEVAAVRQVPGVDRARSLPCVTEQTKFASDVTGAKVRATSSRQDNCVMVGVDPQLSLGGDRPVFNFRFVRGNRMDALSKLQQGRYCLVPDHFERESGLSIGDKFGVIPPSAPKTIVEYEIAGVVSMNGWHWMSKVGLRNRGGGRSAGLMFAAFDQVRQDFEIKRINAFWLNGDGLATEDQIKASIEKIAERSYDPSLQRGGGRGMGFGAGMAGVGFGNRGSGGRTTVNLRSREGVRMAIRDRADGIIWLLSRLPLVTLLVTSLGVMNTIISSIRARRWDMGIMRTLGVTRFGLFRMILCESILVGIAACVLSFAFGTMAGYCGTGVTRYVNVRGGQVTPLIIPWMQIGLGFAMTLGLCLLAALWPAVRVGRQEPLKLLQAGRTGI